MAYPFQTVVQHHEGSGAPSDNIMRFAQGGYSYGIGVNAWGRFRNPVEDYSTAGFNHVVVGVCLSGDRNAYPLTDTDVVMMREIAADAKSHGWLVQLPNVTPHREMGGENKTVCPGNNVAPPDPAKGFAGNADAWLRVVEAYRGTTTEDDVPADKDFVDALTTSEGSWKLQYDGGVSTVTGPFYGSYFSLPASARNDPTRRFSTIFPNFDAPGYAIMSTHGEVYNFKVKA